MINIKRLPFNFGTLLSKTGVPLAKAATPILYQASSITSKHFLDRSVKKPAPWPYKHKKYTNFHSMFRLDNTLGRFDENTQLIVVEGNIGSGKTELAKKLADEFEMLYFPEPNVESLYFDSQGFDLRELDHLVPKFFKSCTLKDFYRDPKATTVPMFQIRMYILRLEQYMEALAHILSTGQGVVLERCIFSDLVFMESMHKMGYVSDGVKAFYLDARINTLIDMPLKPTLVIYLDVDVDNILERIKKRNVDYEVNSKVLNKEYLEHIEFSYKQDYLKFISKHSELLIYDWNSYGDVEAVVDDIEKVKFERYDKYDQKLMEWRRKDLDFWEELRVLCANHRYKLINNVRSERFDIPEIFPPAEDCVQMLNLLSQMASYRYVKGFNEYHGDTGLLFKFWGKENYWEQQKYTLYDVFF